MRWSGIVNSIGPGSILYEFGEALGKFIVENPLGMFFTWFLVLYAVFDFAFSRVPNLGDIHKNRLAIIFAFVTSGIMTYLKYSILNLLIFGLPVIYISLGYIIYGFVKSFDVGNERDRLLLGFSITIIIIAIIHFGMWVAFSSISNKTSAGGNFYWMTELLVILIILTVFAVLYLIYFGTIRLPNIFGGARNIASRASQTIGHFTDIERRIEKDINKVTSLEKEFLIQVETICTYLGNVYKYAQQCDFSNESNVNKLKNYLKHSIDGITVAQERIKVIRNNFEDYFKKSNIFYNYIKKVLEEFRKEYPELKSKIPEEEHKVRNLLIKVFREDKELQRELISLLDDLNNKLEEIKKELEYCIDNINNSSEVFARLSRVITICRNIISNIIQNMKNIERDEKIIKRHKSLLFQILTGLLEEEKREEEKKRKVEKEIQKIEELLEKAYKEIDREELKIKEKIENIVKKSRNIKENLNTVYKELPQLLNKEDFENSMKECIKHLENIKDDLDKVDGDIKHLIGEEGRLKYFLEILLKNFLKDLSEICKKGEINSHIVNIIKNIVEKDIHKILDEDIETIKELEKLHRLFSKLKEDIEHVYPHIKEVDVLKLDTMGKRKKIEKVLKEIIPSTTLFRNINTFINYLEKTEIEEILSIEKLKKDIKKVIMDRIFYGRMGVDKI